MRNITRAGLAAAAVLGAAGLPITLTGARLANPAPHQRLMVSQARFPAPAGHRFAVLLNDDIVPSAGYVGVNTFAWYPAGHLRTMEGVKGGVSGWVLPAAGRRQVPCAHGADF